jgi:hypothetical protein
MAEFTVSELNKENITNLYLYGQLNKPENLVDDNLIREPDDENNLTAQTTVNVDKGDAFNSEYNHITFQK